MSNNPFVVINNTNEDIGENYGIITESTIKTRTEEKTNLSSCENPKITVGDPKKITQGFFQLYSSYIAYLVTTSPLDLKVRRRYSDFEWLRNTLIKLYPMNIIPSLKYKSGFLKDEFAESFIAKRSRKLQKFMNYLLLDPLIKNSKILYDFISIDKDENFERQKKEVYDKLEAPKNIYENQSMSGKANIKIDAMKESLYDSVKNKITSKENILYQLNQNIKKLKTKIEDITKHINLISQNFADLNKENIKQFDGQRAIQIYTDFSLIFKNWSDAIKRHYDIISIDIREHFKYSKNNYEYINNIITQVDKNKDIFKKKEKELIAAKDDLVKRGIINIKDFTNLEKKKTSLSKLLPKETQEAITLKINYGYYLNKFFEELERFNSINDSLNAKCFNDNGEIICDIYKKFENDYKEMMAILNKNNN